MTDEETGFRCWPGTGPAWLPHLLSVQTARVPQLGAAVGLHSPPAAALLQTNPACQAASSTQPGFPGSGGPLQSLLYPSPWSPASLGLWSLTWCPAGSRLPPGSILGGPQSGWWWPWHSSRGLLTRRLSRGLLCTCLCLSLSDRASGRGGGNAREHGALEGWEARGKSEELCAELAGCAGLSLVRVM